jgi:hypothetical protein
MGILRAGVISDTHLAQPSPELRGLLEATFRDVDVILHAGDITELAVLEAFAEKEILAVCGNMDSANVRERFPDKRIWKAGKHRIGLIHGWGGKQGVEGRIRREFADVDCLVYGHTHMPTVRSQDGIYYFNPGSFAGLSGAGWKSVGVLEFGETISGRIISL